MSRSDRVSHHLTTHWSGRASRAAQRGRWADGVRAFCFSVGIVLLGTSSAIAAVDYAWWVTATFAPRDAEVEGIALRDLDRDWLRASVLRAADLPATATDPGESVEDHAFSLALEADLDGDGEPERVVVGVFQNKSGGMGRFLLILGKSKNAGSWTKRALFADPGRRVSRRSAWRTDASCGSPASNVTPRVRSHIGGGASDYDARHAVDSDAAQQAARADGQSPPLSAEPLGRQGTCTAVMRTPGRKVGTAPISTVILIGVLAMLAAPPLVAEAQLAGKVPRVAYLNVSSAASATWAVEAFRQGLRELGYIEGQNILIEYRWADGRFERLPALSAELARLQGRCHRCAEHGCSLGGKECDEYDSHHPRNSRRSCGIRARRQPGAAGRECDGAEPVPDSGDQRQTAGATQRGIPNTQPSGGSRQSRESADGRPPDGDRTWRRDRSDCGFASCRYESRKNSVTHSPR